jgi:hypothetical protein
LKRQNPLPPIKAKLILHPNDLPSEITYVSGPIIASQGCSHNADNYAAMNVNLMKTNKFPGTAVKKMLHINPIEKSIMKLSASSDQAVIALKLIAGQLILNNQIFL